MLLILWRDLLTYAGVRWADRGANTSRGHVNIQCPWCGEADPSHHLAIEEETGAYYCRRNPDHGGRSPWWLLRALRVRDIDRLLDDYSTTPIPQRQRPRTKEEKRHLGLRRAEEIPLAMGYLRSRGYPDPVRVSRRFGLMAAPYGRLAARLFFPVSDGEYVGRAVRPGLEPRYLATSPASRLYVPLPEEYDGGCLLLVEGPFDALRLQTAILEIFGRRFGAAVALLGLALTSDKLLHLSRLIDQADLTLVVLDRDQPVSAAGRLAASLEKRTKRRVERAEGPAGRKDPAEASQEEAALWLRDLTARH